MTETTANEFWAIVEIFGHERIAGQVSEYTFGGETFVRVDVPPGAGLHGYCRMFGKGAIYSMTPVDESIARAAAARLKLRPITLYDVASLFDDASPGERQARIGFDPIDECTDR